MSENNITEEQIWLHVWWLAAAIIIFATICITLFSFSKNELMIKSGYEMQPVPSDYKMIWVKVK